MRPFLYEMLKKRIGVPSSNLIHIIIETSGPQLGLGTHW